MSMIVNVRNEVKFNSDVVVGKFTHNAINIGSKTRLRHSNWLLRASIGHAQRFAALLVVFSITTRTFITGYSYSSRLSCSAKIESDTLRRCFYMNKTKQNKTEDRCQNIQSCRI